MSVMEKNGSDVDRLQTDLQELSTAFAVEQATQAGANATMAATQAGQAATAAATASGTWSTMAAGGIGLCTGMFLALALVAVRSD